MNRSSGAKIPDDDAVLEELVREAGELLVSPRPSHLDRLRSAVFSRLAVYRRRSWRAPRRSVLVASCLAAAVALAVAAWTWLATPGWAEVVQAVREKPWIHLKAKTSDVSSEIWLSLTHDVHAQRHGEIAIFDDFRQGVRYHYHSQEKRLVRVPHSDLDKKAVRSFSALFRAMLGGHEFGGEELGHATIIDGSCRTIKDKTRTWIEYEFILRPHYSYAGLRDSTLMKWVFRVHPRSHLPATMTIKVLDDRGRDGGQPKQEIKVVIDYPDEGPIDIFAMGVPRTAEVVDDLPKNEPDAKGEKRERESLVD